MSDLEKFYDAPEFAKAYGMCYQTIIRMIKRGELSAVKLADKWKIPQSEIDRIRQLCDDRKK